jgi:cyclophilin family peptidyl-prolyl cis-trans isomerase/HEAT repeat protein
MEKIVAPDRVVLLAATHLVDPEWLVRAYAARTLGRQKSPRATAYLLQALDDPEVPVVVNAVRALQLISDTTCTRCAHELSRFLGDAHPYVRVTAATALAERFAWPSADSARRDAAFDSLAAHLRDPDAATRGACARALLRRRGLEAFATVTPVLNDSSVYARVAAIDGLRDLPPHDQILRLIRERMAPGHELLERMTAAEILGALHPKTASAELREGLRDTSILYVASCASALADMKDSTSVKSLAAAYVKRAQDAEPDARIAIHDAIRDLGGKSLADSLEKSHPARAPAPRRYEADFGQAPNTRGARIHTPRGDIEIAFYGADAPQTVRNFVRLARQGYFNGNVFHRVVPNFVIQDGDPTGTGSGGPGYTIRCEYNALHYEPGMVGMALSGKDTGGSQWFITHSPQLHLDGRYTIFAHVTRGMDVVNRIVQGDKILKLEILD